MRKNWGHNKKKTKSFLRTLFSFDNGVAELAQSADSLKPLSIFQIDTSLLPCEADISHDGSVGCGATLRILDVNGCDIVAENGDVPIILHNNENIKFQPIITY